MNQLAFLAYASLRRHRGIVRRSEALVSHALEKMDNPYIAFSTGKDSTCIAHLVWRQRPEVPAVYFDAQCSFPESTAYLDRVEMEGRRIIRFPCEPLLETFKRVGGPTSPRSERETMKSTVYLPIAELLRSYGFDGTFVGLRAAENWGRAQLYKYRGGLFWHRGWELWECIPVADWSYDDVWGFIFSNGLDYNQVYEKMRDMPLEDQRISYWAGETKHRHGRWAFLRCHYPGLYNEFVALFPEIAGYF